MGDKKSVFVASIAGYIIFLTPIILLLLSYGWLYFKRPESNADEVFLFLICVGFFIFLCFKGFKLIITDTYLEYRNGFYQTSIISIDEESMGSEHLILPNILLYSKYASITSSKLT